MPPKPTLRKPLGILGILALIALWAFLIGSFASTVGTWPVLLQGLFYLIAGIAWIAPLGPILKWMETGKFR
jgi:Protein of unknown function (DUF2842)